MTLEVQQQEQQQQLHWVCSTGNRIGSSSIGRLHTKQAVQEAALANSSHQKLAVHSNLKHLPQHHLWKRQWPIACTRSTLQHQHQ
jgi:hypothetical protein